MTGVLSIAGALAEGRGRRVPAQPATPAKGRGRRRAVAGQLSADPAPPESAAERTSTAPAAVTILSNLDMKQAVAKNKFDDELEKQQGRFYLLQRQAQTKGV